MPRSLLEAGLITVTETTTGQQPIDLRDVVLPGPPAGRVDVDISSDATVVVGVTHCIDSKIDTNHYLPLTFSTYKI